MNITLTQEQAKALFEKLEIIMTEGNGVDLFLNGNGFYEEGTLLLSPDEEAYTHLVEITNILETQLGALKKPFRPHK